MNSRRRAVLPNAKDPTKYSRSWQRFGPCIAAKRSAYVRAKHALPQRNLMVRSTSMSRLPKARAGALMLIPAIGIIDIDQYQINIRPHLYLNRGSYGLEPWTAGMFGSKGSANKKTPAGKIAKSLKRTVGPTRQKAFCVGVSLDCRE